MFRISFCTMSDKAWLSFCEFKIIRQITNLRIQDSDQRTEVAECWVHQRSLSLLSSDRQVGVVELLSLNLSSDHKQQQLYHQLLLWHCWWFCVLDFFVFRIWYSAICLSSGRGEHKPENPRPDPRPDPNLSKKPDIRTPENRKPEHPNYRIWVGYPKTRSVRKPELFFNNILYM
jgi:hypothetical protein